MTNAEFPLPCPSLNGVYEMQPGEKKAFQRVFVIDGIEEAAVVT